MVHLTTSFAITKGLSLHAMRSSGMAHLTTSFAITKGLSLHTMQLKGFMLTGFILLWTHRGTTITPY